MGRLTRALLAGCASALALAAADASAQAGPQGAAQTAQATQAQEPAPFVRDRVRPELDPLGVRLGGFLLFPQVTTGLTYTDNVFFTRDNKQSDLIATATPSFRLVSDFGRHEVRALGRVEAGRFLDNRDESYVNYDLEAGGRYDFGNRADASGTVFHRRASEGRDDPNSAAAFREPVVFTTTGGRASYTQPFGRFNASVGAGAQAIDYRDTPLRAGGTSDQDDRDRNVYDVNARLGYQIQPAYEAFVRAGYSWIRYDRARDNAGFARDSDGYEVVAGARIDLTGLVVGQVFAGYFRRDYDDARLRAVDGLSFGGRLDWAVTRLTTVYGEAQRNVVETTSGGASAIDQTVLLAGVDHELLRQVILNAEFRYVANDFRGIAREDDVYRLRLGATYTLNRNLFVEGGYSYETRESNVRAREFDNNVVLVRIGARL